MLFSLQLLLCEVLVWHHGLRKWNLAIASVILLAMSAFWVNSCWEYLSLFNALYLDQGQLSTLSVQRMKISFSCHITLRLGRCIHLCFAIYLLCPVSISVIRGIQKGIMMLKSWRGVSVLGPGGVWYCVVLYWGLLLPSSGWNFRHEDGEAYSSKSLYSSTSLHGVRRHNTIIWTRRILFRKPY